MLPSWPLNNNAVKKRLTQRRAELHKKDVSSLARTLQQLPEAGVSTKDYHGDRVVLGAWNDLPDQADRAKLEAHLKALMLWRKGPFDLLGFPIDAEWQSHMKWNRILKHRPNLRGKKVVDIGASSGYYMFRMLDLSPEWVLGIDPGYKFYFQFHTLQHYAREENLYYEPLKLEDLDLFPECFDTVFCMGILYHQKSPVKALNILHRCLNPGGELYLETLIWPGDMPDVYSPYPTYAKMPNVYFLPTLPTLKAWMKQSGYSTCEVMDVTQTGTEEQRTANYCPPPAQSLGDFLDPEDPNRTVEGYPAPTRALLYVRR